MSFFRWKEKLISLFQLQRNPKTAKQLAEMFRKKTILKQYLTITKFVPEVKTGEIDIPLYRRQIKNITKVRNLN